TPTAPRERPPTSSRSSNPAQSVKEPHAHHDTAAARVTDRPPPTRPFTRQRPTAGLARTGPDPRSGTPRTPRPSRDDRRAGRTELTAYANLGYLGGPDALVPQLARHILTLPA